MLPAPLPASDAARQHEQLRTLVFRDHGELAIAVAARMAALIRERTAAARPVVLGLATGSTPIGVYRELIRFHREEGLSFRHVVTFNLDEYWPMPASSIHSYRRFMDENLFDHVDIDRANIHLPDGSWPGERVAEECVRYEAAIRAAGGIDFQLLGIGKTGHIGFNEPGSGVASRTRRITLDGVTRRDAAADFFGEDHVPREALTMGVATILEAREIALLATGEHKARVLQRAVEGPVSVDVAATYLQRHPATTVWADASAAAELTRVATPWLVDEVEWTDPRTVEAVVWLSKTVGKGILKLTRADYAEHRLSSLLTAVGGGSAGTVNGLVFNRLGARIRGKSKLPKGLQVIVFSPHPDDDVISMGGILRKFVENGNRMTVAYMTSGNIAVFDHDVRRHVDFLERLARDRGLDPAGVRALATRVNAALAAKSPGDVDSAEIQDIKRIIREAEAVSGIEVVGLSRRDARFLNLPFYQTGQVKKSPVTDADVAIVKALLLEVRPQLIFVAGDLSDPHGTHRMCKEAIDRALVELFGPPHTHAGLPGELHVPEVGAHPVVWLYRGAWQEWPVTEATYLVPLSQDELRLKIQAIFKHQSQKDSAPFPGQDEREFWQRVEARNTGLASELDALGLAEYFAMEAYVVR